MRPVFVSFLDLTSDEMANVLSGGDLWYRGSPANREAFRVLESSGRLRKFIGEVSFFSDSGKPEEVLQDVLNHYRSDTSVSAFSGPRSYVRVVGCAYEQILDALGDDPTINLIEKGDEVWIMASS
jgi:hypothetical protein